MPSPVPVSRRLFWIFPSTLSTIFLILGCFLANITSRAESADQPRFGPIPNWVLPGEWDTPNAIRSHPTGQDFLLVDKQVRVATGETHIHNVYQIVSEHGRRDGSQFTFFFDPSYQTLTIHHVDLIRAGERSSRLDPAKVEVLQQERDLDRQMYNGERSALLIMEDVRVGDILDVAFTVQGRNPVFAEKFIETAAIGWSLPVRLQRFRLLVPSDRQITAKLVAGAKDVVATERTSNGERDLIWTRLNLPILDIEDRVPDSEYIYPFLDFSEFKSWRDVVDWALPLYADDPAPSPLLDALVARLRADTDDPESQIVAALTFVQQEIRYLGIEMGAGSHRPSVPEEVLRRRFGDCKDKARLLCAILHGLGRQAAPALVHSSRREAVRERLPSPYAFDHVIVALELEKQRYLVDPTLAYQRGGRLSLRHVGRYGPYLRVAPSDIVGLENAVLGPGDVNNTEITEDFVCKDLNQPTTLLVTTTAKGQAAENLRAYFSTNTIDQIGRQYLDYYTRYYPGITRPEPVEFNDSPQTNTFVVIEHYRIERLFSRTEEDAPWRAELQPATIWDHVRTPNLVQRRFPFALAHPVRLRERITLKLPDEWNLKAEQQTIEDPAFFFHSTVKQPDARTLILDHQWESRADRVEITRLEQFAKNVKQVRDQLGYALTWRPAAPAPMVATAPQAAGINWLTTTLALVLGLGAAVVATGLIRRRNPAPPEPPILQASDKPVDTYSHQARKTQALEGLGGWLILVGIGLVARPFVWLYAIYDGRNAYFDRAAWDALTQRDSTHYNANFALVAPLELGFTIVLLVYSLLLLALFFRRSHLFPRVMQVYLGVGVAYTFFAIWDNSQLGHKIGYEHYQAAIQAIIGAAIWIPYFSISRRVKATFTR